MATLSDSVRDADLAIRRARRALEDVVRSPCDSGSTQREVAQATGRSQPEVARLLARARRRGSRPTAADIAVAVADELLRGDEDFAFRLVRRLVERLELSSEHEAAAFLRDRPLTGERRWDALICGAVAWTCRRRELPAPAWTRVEPLETFWFLRPERALAGRLIQQTPPELAALGIWIDAPSLRGL